MCFYALRRTLKKLHFQVLESLKIQQMVDGDALQKALDEGDTAALQSTISNVLKTEEGARLLSQLEQLFK